MLGFAQVFISFVPYNEDARVVLLPFCLLTFNVSFSSSELIFLQELCEVAETHVFSYRASINEYSCKKAFTCYCLTFLYRQMIV